MPHQAKCLIGIQSHARSEQRMEKLGAGSLLLRFYKASRSPAATSTQRITQAENNKGVGKGSMEQLGHTGAQPRHTYEKRIVG